MADYDPIEHIMTTNLWPDELAAIGGANVRERFGF